MSLHKPSLLIVLFFLVGSTIASANDNQTSKFVYHASKHSQTSQVKPPPLMHEKLIAYCKSENIAINKCMSDELLPHPGPIQPRPIDSSMQTKNY